jgi:hypothetical protein
MSVPRRIVRRRVRSDSRRAKAPPGCVYARSVGQGARADSQRADENSVTAAGYGHGDYWGSIGLVGCGVGSADTATRTVADEARTADDVARTEVAGTSASAATRTAFAARTVASWSRAGHGAQSCRAGDIVGKDGTGSGDGHNAANGGI